MSPVPPVWSIPAAYGGDAPHTGALPNLVVIGAMKCGTTALHRLLGGHPDVAMSNPKELNFFFGTRPGSWADGNWHRGIGWYAGHFPAAAPIRGESSPGYTSPEHPAVAERMASVLPEARLVYLVRDPLQRAISQYRHHRRDGTETRPLEAALLDPESQYVARGRYYERLAPFLARYPRGRMAIVAMEDLLADRAGTLRALFAFAGVDPCRWSPPPEEPVRRPATSVPLSAVVEDRLARAWRDDADRLRELAGAEFPGWWV